MVKINPSRSHTRTYIHQDDQALMTLRPASYRVLRYMANRADAKGVCWPGAALISDDLNMHRQTVYDAWSELESVGVIVCQRESIHDPLTGRMVSKVWQVSPYYLTIAENAIEDARELWKQAAGCDLRPTWSIKSQEYTNQQQNQHQEPMSITSKRTNNNIHQAEGASAPQASTPQAEHHNYHEPPIHIENWPQPQQRSTAPAGTKQGSANVTKSYADPEPLETALHDPHDEQVAVNVNRLGIPLALARGFVASYGPDLCRIALERVAATPASKPAGLFRYLVQKKLVVIGDAPPAVPKPDDWNDFIQS